MEGPGGLGAVGYLETEEGGYGSFGHNICGLILAAMIFISLVAWAEVLRRAFQDDLDEEKSKLKTSNLIWYAVSLTVITLFFVYAFQKKCFLHHI